MDRVPWEKTGDYNMVNALLPDILWKSLPEKEGERDKKWNRDKYMDWLENYCRWYDFSQNSSGFWALNLQPWSNSRWSFLGEFLFSLNPTEMRIKASAENNFGLN